MTNRMTSKFLGTTAALLAGVSIVFAQGAGSPDKGAPIDQGNRMSQSAPDASRSGDGGQHRATESPKGGRAEGSSTRENQAHPRKGNNLTKDSAQGSRDQDSSKGQTAGQGRSDRDNARSSQESQKEQETHKEQREINRNRAQHQDQKGQTAGQGRTERDDARRSEDRTPDKDKTDKQQAQQPTRHQSGSGNQQGQSAKEMNSNSESSRNNAQSGSNAPVRNENTSASQTSTSTHLSAQQQTTLQQSVIHSDKAPRVNADSINFQVHAGVAVPRSVSVVSVSTYPTLIDLFPSYRDYSFFVVEDEVVFVDRDRHIVDVVPAGPRARYSGESHGSRGSLAAIDLAPDDIRIVQRVLIERGLLHGEADGVLGPETRQAITVFQRQQGIQVSGSIDVRTVSSLGVSGKLSQEANQKIEQSQSSTNGSESSTTGKGQAQTSQPQPSQQNATGQTPNNSAGQANSSPQQRQQSTKTGQSSSPNQSNTTGQTTPKTDSGDNAASPSQNAPSEQPHGSGTAPNQPVQNKTESK